MVKSQKKGREYLETKHLGGVDENQFNPGSSSIPITHDQIR